MFSKFKISHSTTNSIKFSLSDKQRGKSISTNYKKIVNEILKEKFIDNKIIDGTKIQDDWFPQVKCDIFLSHSHKDIDNAKFLSGWLKNNFDLDVFIDYNIWGNIVDLLKRIDKAYCYNKETKTYDYTKRNFTTSHVHMMLINALVDMMDRTECLMFFETPNSLNLKKMTHSSSEVTESPWIYNELFLSKIIQTTKPSRAAPVSESRKFTALEKNFRPIYKTDTSHLIPLDNIDIQNWLRDYDKTNNVHSLDVLYNLKKVKN